MRRVENRTPRSRVRVGVKEAEGKIRGVHILGGGLLQIGNFKLKIAN
jgi:hypothetical protein